MKTLISQTSCSPGWSKGTRIFYQKDQLTIDVKGPQDYVSEADHTVEAIMIDFLQSHFPDDGFLGEESSEIKQAKQWVIDPIDGTTNFIRGLPYFCTTLALVEDERVIGGWIFDPTRRRALRGQSWIRRILQWSASSAELATQFFDWTSGYLPQLKLNSEGTRWSHHRSTGAGCHLETTGCSGTHAV